MVRKLTEGTVLGVLGGRLGFESPTVLLSPICRESVDGVVLISQAPADLLDELTQ